MQLYDQKTSYTSKTEFGTCVRYIECDVGREDYKEKYYAFYGNLVADIYDLNCYESFDEEGEIIITGTIDFGKTRLGLVGTTRCSSKIPIRIISSKYFNEKYNIEYKIRRNLIIHAGESFEEYDEYIEVKLYLEEVYFNKILFSILRNEKWYYSIIVDIAQKGFYANLDVHTPFIGDIGIPKQIKILVNKERLTSINCKEDEIFILSFDNKSPYLPATDWLDTQKIEIDRSTRINNNRNDEKLILSRDHLSIELRGYDKELELEANEALSYYRKYLLEQLFCDSFSGSIDEKPIFKNVEDIPASLVERVNRSSIYYLFFHAIREIIDLDICNREKIEEFHFMSDFFDSIFGELKIFSFYRKRYNKCEAFDDFNVGFIFDRISCLDLLNENKEFYYGHVPSTSFFDEIISELVSRKNFCTQAGWLAVNCLIFAENMNFADRLLMNEKNSIFFKKNSTITKKIYKLIKFLSIFTVALFSSVAVGSTILNETNVLVGFIGAFFLYKIFDNYILKLGKKTPNNDIHIIKLMAKTQKQFSNFSWYPLTLKEIYIDLSKEGIHYSPNVGWILDMFIESKKTFKR